MIEQLSVRLPDDIERLATVAVDAGMNFSTPMFKNGIRRLVA